jgi:hypothetical protein
LRHRRPAALERLSLSQGGVAVVGGIVKKLPWPPGCDRNRPHVPVRLGGAAIAVIEAAAVTAAAPTATAAVSAVFAAGATVAAVAAAAAAAAIMAAAAAVGDVFAAVARLRLLTSPDLVGERLSVDRPCNLGFGGRPAQRWPA